MTSATISIVDEKFYDINIPTKNTNIAGTIGKNTAYFTSITYLSKI
jgi:hypothetical protein